MKLTAVRSPAQATDFLPPCVQCPAGPPGPTQPPKMWLLGAPSLGLNLPRHEADQLSLSSAKVKSEWSCTSIPNTQS
jgi:hypothetical protein